MFVELHEADDNAVIWINADKIMSMRMEEKDTAVKLGEDDSYYVKESPAQIASMAQKSPSPNK